MDIAQALIATMGGIIGGLLLFSGMVLGGLHLVRWLGLAQDPPLSALAVPPAPPLRDLSERAGAPAIAALQARRAGLFQRAAVLRGGPDLVKAAAAAAVVTGLELDPPALDRAAAALSTLET